MPLQNLVGWTATAAAFMTLSRLLWGAEVPVARIPVAFPAVLYGINVAFAMALNASVGLWPPIVLAAGLGLAPLLLLRRPAPAGPAPALPWARAVRRP
jgi:uncharacterized membrane protein